MDVTTLDLSQFGSAAEMLQALNAQNGNAPAAAPAERANDKVELVDVALLETDYEPLQPRTLLYDPAYAKDLAERLVENGPELLRHKPITVYVLDGIWHVPDGHQRVAATRAARLKQIYAIVVRDGTWEQAKEIALASNGDHGLPLTDSDRRRKVAMGVDLWQADIEAGKLSMNRFAQRTNLSVSFVSKQWKALGVKIPTTRIVKRGDTEYVQQADNIGKATKRHDEEVEQEATDQVEATNDATAEEAAGDAEQTAGATAERHDYGSAVSAATPAVAPAPSQPKPAPSQRTTAVPYAASAGEYEEADLVTITLTMDQAVELARIVEKWPASELKEALQQQL